MKKGFTLAEVLITLAIIGVVAALTIPVLVQKYQNRQYYTQFMKAYNTIVNFIDLSVVDNGNPENWTFDESNSEEALNKYVLPYLKVSSMCAIAMNGECGNYNISLLSGEKTEYPFYYIAGMLDGTHILTLADGTSLSVGLWHVGADSSRMPFTIDINGSKGPNTVGRDIFAVYYERSYDGENHTFGQWAFNGDYDKGGQDDGSGHIIGSNCDPSSNHSNNGFGCGGRLIEEGKMDY